MLATLKGSELMNLEELSERKAVFIKCIFDLFLMLKTLCLKRDRDACIAVVKLSREAVVVDLDDICVG